jgi:LPS sulfotransferase NodH
MAPDGTELERLSEPEEPFYDAVEIASHLAELTALDQDWKDWFVREKVDPLCITYDELSADPIEALTRILDQLGLDREVAKGISPAVAKLADATSRSWMERFLAERDTDSVS